MASATTTTSAPVVDIRGLYKRFGDRVAVDGIDLQVPAGICYGLLGPNGAGKTTTLRMVYGVTQPTSGSISVFGLEIASHRRTIRNRLGVTLQDNALIEPLTPEENLRVFARYHLMREPELSTRIEELIEFLQLASHRDVPVRELSGGFQRRLAIALSLVNRPELIILDEPTTGLDPAVRLALWSRIRMLRNEGTTVLLTTHYMDEAERLCDRVGIIADGKLIAEGAPRQLIADMLAKDTVELDCNEQEEARYLEGFAQPLHRLRAGERLMLHVDSSVTLIEHIRSRSPDADLHLIARPTTLEDVFLALTGTTLEAGDGLPPVL